MKPLLKCWYAVSMALLTILAAKAGEPPLPPKLEPAVPFAIRDGLPNVAEKLKAGQEINVVFLGGSITVAAKSPNGYVTFVENWLKTHYPTAKVNIFDAGISGTGSDFGARRYDRDVLAKNPDLVFVEFCVNDGDSDRTEPMERIVHKTWLKNPKTDLVFFYTLEKHHLDYYKNGTLPPSASSHERVAAFYGIPTIGTGLNVATKVNSGELKWEQFSHDGCHPTQEGYIFFDTVFDQALSELMKAAPANPHELGKSITPNLQPYPPPLVAKPVEYKGEIVSAQGEKPSTIYALPVPGTNWIKEPAFVAMDGKSLWRLSWMPREMGGKFDPSIGSDKSKWETNSMDWLEEGASFNGPAGLALFGPNYGNTAFGVSPKEIGIIRFVAPETGRYLVTVKSGPWMAYQQLDKEMSLAVGKFTWNGGTGESLAFQKEFKKDSKGLAMNVETHLLAGEEVVFFPDSNATSASWGGFRIVIGYLGL